MGNGVCDIEYGIGSMGNGVCDMKYEEWSTENKV